MAEGEEGVVSVATAPGEEATKHTALVHTVYISSLQCTLLYLALPNLFSNMIVFYVRKCAPIQFVCTMAFVCEVLPLHLLRNVLPGSFERRYFLLKLAL